LGCFGVRPQLVAAARVMAKKSCCVRRLMFRAP
jgi:hypothetical protein